MESELKKANMLLKSLIFHYHGLDDDERKLLDDLAKKMKAEEALQWANDFISKDYISAFERSKEFFSKTVKKEDKKTQLKLLVDVWEESHYKGYVTEMETTAIITLAKDWEIQKEFLHTIDH